MGILSPEDDAFARPWVPRSQKQMGMSAQEIEIDNYCRELMNMLNKATPQNIDILLDKMANFELNSEFYIEKLVQYIFYKAVAEPLYSEVYAEMCCTLNQVVDRCISSTSSTANDLAVISLGIFKMLIIKECHLAFDEVFKKNNQEYINDKLIMTKQKLPVQCHL